MERSEPQQLQFKPWTSGDADKKHSELQCLFLKSCFSAVFFLPVCSSDSEPSVWSHRPLCCLGTPHCYCCHDRLHLHHCWILERNKTDTKNPRHTSCSYISVCFSVVSDCLFPEPIHSQSVQQSSCFSFLPSSPLPHWMLKGEFPQKQTFCHHLLNLLLQASMPFIRGTQKNILVTYFSLYTIEVNGIQYYWYNKMF